jgi:hypothetical protein
MVPLWLAPSDDLLEPANGTPSSDSQLIKGITVAELPDSPVVLVIHRSLTDGYAAYRLELPEFAEASPNGPRTGWANQSGDEGEDGATAVAVAADGTSYITSTAQGLLSDD